MGKGGLSILDHSPSGHTRRPVLAKLDDAASGHVACPGDDHCGFSADVLSTALTQRSRLDMQVVLDPVHAEMCMVDLYHPDLEFYD